MRRQATILTRPWAALALLAAICASGSGCAVITLGPTPTWSVVQQQASAFRWLLFGAAILLPAAAWLGWACSRRRCGVRSWMLLLACESAAFAGAVGAWKYFERQAVAAAATTVWVAVSTGPYGTNYVALPTATPNFATPPAPAGANAPPAGEATPHND